MTREEYLEMRNKGSAEIMFHYYNENFDKSKHKPQLTMEEFAKAMQAFPFMQQAFQVSCIYYDAKFNIVKIATKEGQIIRYE